MNHSSLMIMWIKTIRTTLWSHVLLVLSNGRTNFSAHRTTATSRKHSNKMVKSLRLQEKKFLDQIDSESEWYIIIVCERIQTRDKKCVGFGRRWNLLGMRVFVCYRVCVCVCALSRMISIWNVTCAKNVKLHRFHIREIDVYSNAIECIW